MVSGLLCFGVCESLRFSGVWDSNDLCISLFCSDHFPFFKSAPSGWKNSVRHNLSLNKCFEKIEKPGNNGARKGCLWALNPAKIGKMDEEVQKWSRKDPLAITRAMSDPGNFPSTIVIWVVKKLSCLPSYSVLETHCLLFLFEIWQRTWSLSKGEN